MLASDSLLLSVIGGGVLSMATLLGNPVFTSQASSKPAGIKSINTPKPNTPSTTSTRYHGQSVATNSSHKSHIITAINGPHTTSDKTSVTTDATSDTISSHMTSIALSPTSTDRSSQPPHSDSTSSGLSSVNQNAAIAISAIGKSTAGINFHAFI